MLWIFQVLLMKIYKLTYLSDFKLLFRLHSIHFNFEKILRPIGLIALFDNSKPCTLNDRFKQLIRSRNTIILFINNKPFFTSILLQYYKPIRIEIFLRSNKKLYCLLFRQIPQNPLHPHTIVFLLKFEILQPSTVVIPYFIVLFEVLLGCLDIFIALIRDINLNINNNVLF